MYNTKPLLYQITIEMLSCISCYFSVVFSPPPSLATEWSSKTFNKYLHTPLSRNWFSTMWSLICPLTQLSHLILTRLLYSYSHRCLSFALMLDDICMTPLSHELLHFLYVLRISPSSLYSTLHYFKMSRNVKNPKIPSLCRYFDLIPFKRWDWKYFSMINNAFSYMPTHREEIAVYDCASMNMIIQWISCPLSAATASFLTIIFTSTKIAHLSTTTSCTSFNHCAKKLLSTR